MTYKAIVFGDSGAKSTSDPGMVDSPFMPDVHYNRCLYDTGCRPLYRCQPFFLL